MKFYAKVKFYPLQEKGGEVFDPNILPSVVFLFFPDF